MPNTANITASNSMLVAFATSLKNAGASASSVNAFINSVITLINTDNSSTTPTLLVEEINDLTSKGWVINYVSAANAISDGQTDITKKQIQIVVNPQNLSGAALAFVGTLAYEIGHAEDRPQNTIEYVNGTNHQADNALAIGAEVAEDFIGEGKSLYNQIQVDGYIAFKNLSGTDQAQKDELQYFSSNPPEAILLGASDMLVGGKSTVTNQGAFSYYWAGVLGESGLNDTNTDSQVLSYMQSMSNDAISSANFSQNSSSGNITMTVNFASSNSKNVNFDGSGNNTTLSSYVSMSSGYGTIAVDSGNSGGQGAPVLTNAAEGSGDEQIFNFANGGSVVDAYSSGGTVETITASMGTTLLYRQINTISATSGQIQSESISGIGDVIASRGLVAINIATNSSITEDGSDDIITVGAKDTIIAGTTLYPHFLNTDTITFEGNTIAGDIAASGYQDDFGRTYTLSGTTLTITGKTAGDSLTISNFVNGDFGVSMNAFENLGALPFGATGINSAGMLIGYDVNAQSGFGNQGVLYNATTGKTTLINDPHAVNSTSIYAGTTAYAISDTGIVVGSYYDINRNKNGFTFNTTTGAYTTIDAPYIDPSNPPNSNYTTLTAVSANGKIILGNYADSSSGYYDFIDNNGIISKLPSMYSNMGSLEIDSIQYNGVNNAGQIIGYLNGIDDNTGNEVTDAFIDLNGTFTYLPNPTNLDPNLPGQPVTPFLTGINDNGLITGYVSDDLNNIEHYFSFVYNTATKVYTPLYQPGQNGVGYDETLGINDNNLVLGEDENDYTNFVTPVNGSSAASTFTNDDTVNLVIGQSAVIDDQMLPIGTAGVAALGNNTFTVNGDFVTIGANAGGNNMTINGSNNTVNAFKGDTVTLTGEGISANDTSTQGNVVNLSSGKLNLDEATTATLFGSTNTITDGGDDYLTISSGTGNTIKAAAGDDLTITGSNTIVDTGGLTDDSITFDGKAVAGTVTLGTTAGYALSGSTLTYKSGSDMLTIDNFVSGDFGIDIAPTNVTGNSGSYNLAAGTNDSVTGNSNKIIAAASVVLDLTGNTNTVTGVSGDNFSLSGTGNGVTVTGSNAVVSDDATSSGNTFKFTGNNNTVTVAGATNTVTLAGTGNNFTGVATDIVNISGNGQTTQAANLDRITLSSGKVNLAATSSAVINGASNTITLLANDDLTVTGASNTISSLGATDNVSITGNGNIITAPVAATAATDVLTLDGKVVAGTVTLGKATSAGLLYTLSGTTLKVAYGSDILTINNFASGDFGIKPASTTVEYNESSNTISVAASTSASVTGNSNTITGLTGDDIEVFGNSNKVTQGTTGNAYLIGTGDSITAGNGDTVTLGSNGQTTTAASLYTVTLASGKLALAASTSANLKGSSNAVTVLSKDNLNITGGSNTITSGTSTGDNISIISGVNNIITTVAGNTISVAGDGQVTAVASMDTLNATTDTIKLAATSSATVIGNGNTITGLTSDNVYVTGNTNTVTVGTGSNVTLKGTGEIVNAAASDTVSIDAGSTATINGSGSNVLNFITGTGNTTIALTSSGTNTLGFGTTITDEKLWFKQSGNNLLIDVLGSNEQITVTNWYSATSHQAQEITADGLKLDTQFTQLVQAMATYSAANTGFNPTTATTMPTDTTLQGAIAAAWHH